MNKRNFFIRIGRNTVAIFKRLYLAYSHKSTNELLSAILTVMEGFFWLISAFLAAISLAAAFVKPHCLVLFIALVLLCALVSRNMTDRKRLERSRHA